jgi:hypothetical protein
MPTFPELVSTTKSSVLTMKSPAVARLTSKLDPLAGASVNAPELVAIDCGPVNARLPSTVNVVPS